MKKFADLTKAQKTFVVRFMEVCPEMRSQKTVTFKDLLKGFELLKEQRGTTGEKLGFPLWLQKTNLVDRGTYQMPWPNATELSAYAAEKTAPKAVKVAKTPAVKAPKAVKAAKAVSNTGRLQRIIDESPAHDEDVEDFNQILRDNGIEVI